ncbi:DUF4105 domain-containing protein [Dyella monticola]|uniref:DUF4105 domain-containing protein n=1 Tax=Dyella monticola TaxID=1927958 RepID=A0A370X7P1_9GAMM|nr:DUF4105 domain-containing protein [Dyella monticola]RDS84449.1 DUF4105 domain-containing protein [Dyella monticola]
MLVRWALWVLLIMGVLLSGGWATLALWYQFPGRIVGRCLSALAWALFVFSLLIIGTVHRSGVAFGVYALAFIALLSWWRTIMPSNHRDWADDVARSLAGEVEGKLVTLYNVRNFRWRSKDDYDIHWETRRYDLARLISADLILSSWGMPGIVHALLSFGFDHGSHLVFSVEVRRRRNQAFSSIGGFFKHFERTIVAADERDLIRVRTNVRMENDHLFRLRMSKSAMRALLLAYMHEANELAATPAYYNTVTSNCVTIVYDMAKEIDPGLAYDYRLLLTAYLPSYLYEVGALDRRYPLSELIARGDITARARATGPDDDFSRAIRTPLAP